MIDFKIGAAGDLEITPAGDICTTSSIAQAVRIRLRWFLNEWRLAPAMGFPYFEEVFVKNPNLSKIRFLLREEIMAVEGVSEVVSITIAPDPHTRKADIAVIFTAGNETFREEVNAYG